MFHRMTMVEGAISSVILAMSTYLCSGIQIHISFCVKEQMNTHIKVGEVNLTV